MKIYKTDTVKNLIKYQLSNTVLSSIESCNCNWIRIEDINIQIDLVHQIIISGNNDSTIDIQCIFNDVANNVTLNNIPIVTGTPNIYTIDDCNNITLYYDIPTVPTYGDIVINPRLSINNLDNVYLCYVIYLDENDTINNISTKNETVSLYTSTPLNEYQLTNDEIKTWSTEITDDISNQVVELWLNTTDLFMSIVDGWQYEIIDIQYNTTKHQYINLSTYKAVTPYDSVIVDGVEIDQTTVYPVTYQNTPLSNTYTITGSIQLVDKYNFTYGLYNPVIVDIQNSEVYTKCDNPYSLTASILKSTFSIRCQFQDKGIDIFPSHYLIQLYDTSDTLTYSTFLPLGIKSNDIYTNTLTYTDTSLWGFDYKVKIYMYQSEDNVVSDNFLESETLSMYYYEDIDLETTESYTYNEDGIAVIPGLTYIDGMSLYAYCNMDKYYLDLSGWTIDTRTQNGFNYDVENKILYCDTLISRSIKSSPNIVPYQYTENGVVSNGIDTRNNKLCIVLELNENTVITSLPLKTTN